MTWYAAHLILYTEFDDGNQDIYPVWENALMIAAEFADEAFHKADRKGAAEASPSRMAAMRQVLPIRSSTPALMSSTHIVCSISV